jgi:hypothetical protein
MKTVSTETIDAMRMALVALCQDVSEFIDRSGSSPAAGSLAACELAETRLTDQLATAYSQAHLLLECAEDYSAALTRLLCSPTQVIAPWTCVGAAVESAAFCCWLVTDRIAARERVARSLAFRYEGLRQQLTAARAKDTGLSCARAKSRLREAEVVADALGYDPMLDKKGRRRGVGTRMPSATECVHWAFRDDTLFRVLSAMVHAHPWAVIQLGFESAVPTEPTLLAKCLKPNSAAFLLMMAADAIAKPAWGRARLLGHDLGALRRILGARYTEMGLVRNEAFWTDTTAG